MSGDLIDLTCEEEPGKGEGGRGRGGSKVCISLVDDDLDLGVKRGRRSSNLCISLADDDLDLIEGPSRKKERATQPTLLLDDFDDTVEREKIRAVEKRVTDEERLTLLFLEQEQAARQAELSSRKYNCGICMDDFQLHEMVTMACLTHRFCSGCLAGYIKSKIDEGQVGPKSLFFPGVGCSATPITIFEIKHVISDPTTIEKFERFTLKAYCENSDNNCRFCPKCNVWFAEIPSDAEDEPVWRRVKCGEPTCGYNFCGLCGENPHKGQSDQDLTCHQFQQWKVENTQADTLFEQFLDREADSLQQCPKCLNLASLTNNHCKFTYCKCTQKFCFLCGVSLEEVNHFSHYNSVPGSTGPYGNVCRGVNDQLIVCPRLVGPRAKTLTLSKVAKAAPGGARLPAVNQPQPRAVQPVPALKPIKPIKAPRKDKKLRVKKRI